MPNCCLKSFMKKELKMNKLNVVCGALVIDRKVMIAQRNYGSSKGFFEFPGGKVEKSETEYIWTTPDHIYDYNFFKSDKMLVEALKGVWPCLTKPMKPKC